MSNVNGLDAYRYAAKAEEKIDASKKLRVGIIGTGWIAESHIASYLKQPDVEIVAGADLIPGKAKAFFEKFRRFAFPQPNLRRNPQNMGIYRHNTFVPHNIKDNICSFAANSRQTHKFLPCVGNNASKLID